MARYVIENRINTVKDLVQFDLAGYSYNKNESSASSPVFFRKSS
jgi:cytoplasmic iron level regulating protein YaaA (DUF328/UPF0246 family)